MDSSPFRFKQFVVHQDKCAMKISTDAVLLGAWVKAGHAKKILDIGTGTGVIALMLAQKSVALIDAIEIDSESCTQARHNFGNSPWKGRLRVIHGYLQEYKKNSPIKYDLIVSNPPYFDDAYLASVETRNIAKHNETLSFDDIISGVNALLSEGGRFCVILPSMESGVFRSKAIQEGLYCSRIARVKTKTEKQEKRILMEFCNALSACVQEEFSIHDESLQYTKEFIELTKDYYLAF